MIATFTIDGSAEKIQKVLDVLKSIDALESVQTGQKVTPNRVWVVCPPGTPIPLPRVYLSQQSVPFDFIQYTTEIEP